MTFIDETQITAAFRDWQRAEQESIKQHAAAESHKRRFCQELIKYRDEGGNLSPFHKWHLERTCKDV